MRVKFKKSDADRIAANWPDFAESLKTADAEGDCVSVLLPNTASAESSPAKVQTGPGTELKRLLLHYGIKAADTCYCESRAAEMDRNGADWCEENMDVILGWLREAATAEGMKIEAEPLFIPAALELIRDAVAAARHSRYTTSV